MTTNKKKSAKQKPEKPKETTAAAAPAPAAPEIQQKGVFLSSQFTILILVAMGAARMMEVRSASQPESDKCIRYLGESACQDPIVSSLLSLKFHFAIQVFCMVVLYMLLAWNTESMLSHINGLLVLSPIMAGMAVLLGNSAIIPYPAAKGQCIPAVVLALISLPANDQPFSNARIPHWKTVPSIVFATLATASMIQAVNCLLDSYDADGMTIPQLLPWPEHLVTYQPALRPIIQFFAVDYLLMGLLYAYAWHSFPDHTQRVRINDSFSIRGAHDVSYQPSIGLVDSIDGHQNGRSLLPTSHFRWFVRDWHLAIDCDWDGSIVWSWLRISKNWVNT